MRQNLNRSNVLRFDNRRFRPQPRRPRSSPRIFGILAGICITAVVAVDPIASVAFPVAGCTVKGNISYNGGTRIYHIPGQTDYADTKISLLKGERWFCSEGAAIDAGWRKAYR